LVHLGDAGKGVNRKRVDLGDAGKGVNRRAVPGGLAGRFAALSDRLRDVRVCCGDWTRLTGPAVTTYHGTTAIFLDPPYADTAGRDPQLYAEDSLSVAHEVREWAIAHGDDPKLRIALCGYEGEHRMPDSWDCVPWKAHGGYGNASRKHANPNRGRERIWFSPHCVAPVPARIVA
jgi:hypothetical protein